MLKEYCKYFCIRKVITFNKCLINTQKMLYKVCVINISFLGSQCIKGAIIQKVTKENVCYCQLHNSDTFKFYIVNKYALAFINMILRHFFKE